MTQALLFWGNTITNNTTLDISLGIGLIVICGTLLYIKFSGGPDNLDDKASDSTIREITDNSNTPIQNVTDINNPLTTINDSLTSPSGSDSTSNIDSHMDHLQILLLVQALIAQLQTIYNLK